MIIIKCLKAFLGIENDFIDKQSIKSKENGLTHWTFSEAQQIKE